MTAGRRLLAVLLLTLAVSFGGAGVASAHTGLEGSTPADGSTLSSLPAPVRLKFADPVLKDTAAGVLTGPGGRVELARPVVRGALVTFALPTVTAAGRYRLAWRVVAEDGHPIKGVLTFRVAAKAIALPTPHPTPTGSPSNAPAGAVSSPSPTPTIARTSAADGGSVALAATEAVGTPGSGPLDGPAVGWGVFALLVLLAVLAPRVLARRRTRASAAVPS